MRKVYYVNNTELRHYGIKGQRWGVRRFQNEDGTLTEMGKKRYGSVSELERDYRKADVQGAKVVLEGASRSLDTAGQTVGNIGRQKSKVINKADYSHMSDDEIRRKINRLNMERSYGELTGDMKKVRSGQDWTREILQTTGAVVGIGATIALTIKEINSIKVGKKNKK